MANHAGIDNCTRQSVYLLFSMLLVYFVWFIDDSTKYLAELPEMSIWSAFVQRITKILFIYAVSG